MSQTKILINTLKRIMKSKGITYRFLADQLSLSEPTIKRSFNDEETLSVKRMEHICVAIGVNFAELVRLSELKPDEKKNVLTDAQEEALSLDLNVFKVFYLLLKNWSLAKIESKFKIRSNDLQKILLRLDKLKLIELHENNKIKILTGRNIRWKKNGPIYKIFETEMKERFLDRPFDASNEKFTLLAGTLSPASQAILKQKLERFERELEEFIELDFYLEKDGSPSTAIVLAMGPVRLSLFE